MASTLIARVGWLAIILSSAYTTSHVVAPPRKPGHWGYPGTISDPDNRSWYSRCYSPRGATQGDVSAITDYLLQAVDRRHVVLAPEQCAQEKGNTTMLRLCNKSTQVRKVKYAELSRLHQNLLRDCTQPGRKRDDNLPLGGLRNEDGLQMETWGLGDQQNDYLDLRKRTSYPRPAQNPQRVKGATMNRRNCDAAFMPMDGNIVYKNCEKPQGHELDDEGNCPLWKDSLSPCMQYCEERRRYFWGPEQPFPQSNMAYCPRGTATCGWSDGLSLSVSKGWLAQLTVNFPQIPEIVTGPAAPFIAIFNSLANMYNSAYAELKSVSEGISQSASHGFNGKDDFCGYWTFIPRMTETCGTISVYRKTQDEKCVKYNDEPPITYKDQCALKAITGVDGRPLGESIIVWYDCDSMRHAPDSEQNPLYLRPGSPLPDKRPGQTGFVNIEQTVKPTDGGKKGKGKGTGKGKGKGKGDDKEPVKWTGSYQVVGK